MPSTFKSPYGTSFKSAVKRGVSYTAAVQSIASRTGKTPTTIWQSLFKAGLVWRQKVNGTWIYWPSFKGKKSVAGSKPSQTQQWQWFVDWCITSGFATPDQFKKAAGSQPAFFTFARKFFAKQFGSSTSSSTGRKTTKRRSTTSKAKRRTTKARSRTTSRGTSYKFPTTKSRSRSTTRRYRRAA